MKNLLIAVLVYTAAISLAKADDCLTTYKEISQDIVYKVNKEQPNHLKGAVIIVRLADGRESSVPAEKFMVVRRVQKTIVGQNKLLSTKLTCNKDTKKNIVYVGAKREAGDVEVKTQNKTAQVDTLKTLTPSLNYMRRKILNSDLNLGAGVDKNGQVSGTIGLDF